MADSGRTTYRYRLSVPDRDTAVLEWLDAQDSPSMSLRLLIKEDIARHGLMDVTCRMIESGVAAAGRSAPSRSRRTQAGRAAAVPSTGPEPAPRARPGRKPEPEPVAEEAYEAPAARVAEPEPVREDAGKAPGNAGKAPEPEAAQVVIGPGPRAEVQARPAPAEPQGPGNGQEDSMAFLNRMAGSAGGLMGMLAMDEDEEGGDGDGSREE